MRCGQRLALAVADDSGDAPELVDSDRHADRDGLIRAFTSRHSAGE